MEKLQRTSDDIIILNDEEFYFRKKLNDTLEHINDWKCTICSKSTDKCYPHPVLRVIICFDCLRSYENNTFLSDKDGTDKNCRWCGEKAKKYSCASCTIVICKNCLERNFETDYIKANVNNSWNCFLCYPKFLWKLRAICSKAMENNNREREIDIETIDFKNENSPLSLSQQVLVDSETMNERISSEVDSEINFHKKVPKPLDESEESNESISTLYTKSSICSSKMNNQQSSESICPVLKEAEEDLNCFLNLFSKRVEQFSHKFIRTNKNSFCENEKLVKKINLFCDKAVENLQCIKQKSTVSFEKWSANNKAHTLSSSPTNSLSPNDKSCDVKTPTKSKSNNSINKNDASIEKKFSNLFPKKVKKKVNYNLKFNLSLKSLEMNSDSNDTEDTLELINKNAVTHDDISPKKNNRILESIDVREPKIDSVPQCSDSLIKSLFVKSDVEKVEVHNSTEPKYQESNSSVLESINEKKQIKEEINDNFDTETEIYEQNINGEEYLKNRIQEDFGDDLVANDTAVCITNYLCDQTGEFCRSYCTLSEESSSCTEKDFEFSDSASESDKSDNNWNWPELMQNDTTIEEKQTNILSVNNEQIEEINTLESNEQDSTVRQNVYKNTKIQEKYTENCKMEPEEQILKEQITNTVENRKELDKNSSVNSDIENLENDIITDSECIRSNVLQDTLSDSENSTMKPEEQIHNSVEESHTQLDKENSLSSDTEEIENDTITDSESIRPNVLQDTLEVSENSNMKPEEQIHNSVEESHKDLDKENYVSSDTEEIENDIISDLKSIKPNVLQNTLGDSENSNMKPEKQSHNVAEESNKELEKENSVSSDIEEIENDLITDSESERRNAFYDLLDDSDFSVTNLSLSDSNKNSSSSSSDNLDYDYDKDYRTPGYVKQLDIATELAKLYEHNTIVETKNESVTGSNQNNNVDDFIKNDPKLQMDVNVKLFNDLKLYIEPAVLLEKVDFENCFGLKKRGKVYNISKSSDSEDEIKRLTNLNLLQKRTATSDSDAENFKPRRKKKKIRSGLSSCSSDSDLDVKPDPDSEFQFKITEEENNSAIENCLHISMSDEQSNDGYESDDDDIIIIDEKKKKTKKEKSISIKHDKKSKWRNNKLLTDNLTISSDSDATDNSIANEHLRMEEEKYLENVDKEKTKRRISVETLSDDSDAIVLSDENFSNSDDDEVLFVDLKRSRESDDEDSLIKNKKGRKNIREVLLDSELHAETIKADKEEAERKERLSLKQKTLETVLSESHLSQDEIGFVLEVDEQLKTPTVTVHHTLVPPLKEHQKAGIKFMWDVCFESVSELKKSNGAGCILAHCMGLGKSMQVVVLTHTLLTHPETNVKRVLIVCPLSTVYNWRKEFENTLSVCSRNVNVFAIRPDYQRTYYNKIFEVKRWCDNGGVLLLGYEAFYALFTSEKFEKLPEIYKNILTENLLDPGPDLVVCDEGHMLKNGKTTRFKSLSRLKTMRRIILTGTPLQNNLIEYYHMVSFVKPHLLGTLEEFKNRFVNPILNGQYEDSNFYDIQLMKKRSHILHKKLENTVQRFEESELVSYLPPKHDYVLHVQLSSLQIKLYEHYLQMLDTSMKTLFKNYHALQNIWTHPALLKNKFDKKKNPKQKKQKLYDEDFVQALDPDSECADVNAEWFKDLIPDDISTNISYGVKMEILFSIIKECGAIGDKLLVFSSSIDELDLIESFLKEKQDEIWIRGTDYYRMDGTVVPEKREKYCTEFNNPNNSRARLFLVSHKVGGLGLNLTAANRVVLMDVSWNPAYDMQSVFRIYRFGQTKNTYIYRFVSMGTMEDVVYNRAVTKLAISGRVVDEHQIKRHFNSDDLQRMYTLKADFPEPSTPTIPSDRLLAKLWEIHKPTLYKFCDHKSLLENQTHEELNEEERQLAWEEYREMEHGKQTTQTVYQQLNVPGPSNYIPSGKELNFHQRKNIQQNTNEKFKKPNRLPSLKNLMFRSENTNLPYSFIPELSFINNTLSTVPTFPVASTSNLTAVNYSVNNLQSSNNNYLHKTGSQLYIPVHTATNSHTNTANTSILQEPFSITTGVNCLNTAIQYQSNSLLDNAGQNNNGIVGNNNKFITNLSETFNKISKKTNG